MRKSWYGWLFVGLFAWTYSARGATPQVGGGEGFSCALGVSGRAFCWGTNSAGQIGNGAGMGATQTQFLPAEMAGGFVTISSGGGHSCGLQANGSAFCWGDNYWGQLGTGSTNSNGVSLPVRVVSTLPFQAISAGSAHTCALDMSGQAWCWGLNQNSQLGDDSRLTFLSTTPVRVLGSAPGVAQTFKSISAGGAHTCAIDVNDEAWCWGSNVGARAGIDINLCGGTATAPCDFFRPVKTMASQPPLSLRFRSVSAGKSNTCGIDTLGNVQCWGDSFRGSPLSGRADNPAQVANVINAVSLSVGDSSVCSVAANGGLFCWGMKDQGQLGDGTTPAPGAASVTPVRVSGPQDYLSVSVGSAQVCARAANDVLRCWGSNATGQLGLPSGTTVSALPRVVSGLQSTQIATGGRHACSQDAVGVTACWGDDLRGQIGHGRAGTVPLQSVVPTPVARFAQLFLRVPAPPEQLSGIKPVRAAETVSFSRLAVGGQHGCALAANGIAYCWGADSFGQVGNGTRTTAPCRFGPGSAATCVPAPTIVSRATAHVFVDIAAGVAHNCARDSRGIVSCWGSAASGELGSSVTCGSQPCFRRLPTQIQVPFPRKAQMVDVQASDSSTCAVNQTAEVFCWGLLATWSPTAPLMPYPAGPNFVRIGAGAGFACAGAINGAVLCLGDNNSGQLGNGTNARSATPTQITPNLFSTFALSRSFACGIDTGDVWCWGANQLGELGNGTINDSNVPVQVSLGGQFGATSVGVGFAHACAITAMGAVSCWGSNGNGELGNGIPASGPQSAPVAVAGGWRIP